MIIQSQQNVKEQHKDTFTAYYADNIAAIIAHNYDQDKTMKHSNTNWAIAKWIYLCKVCIAICSIACQIAVEK